MLVYLMDGWMEIINNMFSQVTSDKEKKLLFTVFDENRSWYFEENIKKNSEDPTKIDRNDPDFYNSNVMHSGCWFLVSGCKLLNYLGLLWVFVLCKNNVNLNFPWVKLQMTFVYLDILSVFQLLTDSCSTTYNSGCVLAMSYSGMWRALAYKTTSCQSTSQETRLRGIKHMALSSRSSQWLETQSPLKWRC